MTKLKWFIELKDLFTCCRSYRTTTNDILSNLYIYACLLVIDNIKYPSYTLNFELNLQISYKDTLGTVFVIILSNILRKDAVHLILYCIFSYILFFIIISIVLLSDVFFTIFFSIIYTFINIYIIIFIFTCHYLCYSNNLFFL